MSVEPKFFLQALGANLSLAIFQLLEATYTPWLTALSLKSVVTSSLSLPVLLLSSEDPCDGTGHAHVI